MATALDDFVAPDCRFINVKRGQTVYVYSKLLPVEGAGVFWSGSVRTRFYCTSLTLSARSVPGRLSEHNRLQTTSAHVSTIFDYIDIFFNLYYTDFNVRLYDGRYMIF